MIIEEPQENYKSGFISIYRSIKNHWIWSDPIKFQWWIDILLTVNFKSNKVMIGNQLIDCDRGQSVKSLKNWADSWNVSKDSTRNFFTLLAKDNMIKLENLKKTTRLTVLNYDSYQIGLHAEQTQSKRNPNAEQTQSGTNNKYNKENNDKNTFDLFWEHFHKITTLKKTDYKAAFAYWKKLSITEQRKAYNMVPKYFNSLKDKKYCKKARTYLSDKNYNDEFETTESIQEFLNNL